MAVQSICENVPEIVQLNILFHIIYLAIAHNYICNTWTDCVDNYKGNLAMLKHHSWNRFCVHSPWKKWERSLGPRSLSTWLNRLMVVSTT